MPSWLPFIEKVDDDEEDESNNKEISSVNQQPEPTPEQQTQQQPEPTPEQQNQGGNSPPLNNAMDAFQDRVLGIETNIDTVNNELEQLEQKDDILEDRLNSLEDNNEELEKHIKELLGLYDAIAVQVNPLVEEDLQSLIPNLSTEAKEVADTYDLKSIPEEAKQMNESDVVVPVEKEDSEPVEVIEEDFTVEDEDFDPISEDNSQDKYAVKQIRPLLQDEVIALQWIDKLIQEIGFHDTIRTIDYYNQIGWISKPAKHQLIRRLRLLDVDTKDEQNAKDGIPSDVHRFSKAYLQRLNG